MKKYLFVLALISCSNPDIKEPLNTAILGSWVSVSESKTCPSGNSSETFDCKVKCTQYSITGYEITVTTIDNGTSSQGDINYQIGDNKIFLASGEVYIVSLSGNDMTWAYNLNDCKVTLKLKR